MNYTTLSIHKRINWKSWACGKLTKEKATQEWPEDYWHTAAQMASEPAVIMKPRVLQRYARKRGWT